MKRYCKNIDITDRDFISTAVRDCMKKKMTRKDTIRLLCEYSGLPYTSIEKIVKNKDTAPFIDGLIETVIDGIRQEIINQKYIVKPIHYKKKIDGNSGKERKIGIQDVKQQIYDYIAVYAMMDLFAAKIGYYQCNALSGKGQVFGKNALKKWVDNHHIRYAIQSDIRHYYESIDRNILKKMLRRDVKNERILHLVFFLIDTFDVGLAIGSYLSQFLAAYYLSPAYHFVTEQCYKIRKKKDGAQKRVNLVAHALWYADDCVIIGNNLKNLKTAQKLYAEYTKKNLGVEVKDNVKIIDLRNGYIDMMGFKISRKCVTVRASDFLRLRRNHERAKKYARERGNDRIPLFEARSFMSRSEALKHTDSEWFRRKEKIDRTKSQCAILISEAERRNAI